MVEAMVMHVRGGDGTPRCTDADYTRYLRLERYGYSQTTHPDGTLPAHEYCAVCVASYCQSMAWNDPSNKEQWRRLSAHYWRKAGKPEVARLILCLP